MDDDAVVVTNGGIPFGNVFVEALNDAHAASVRRRAASVFAPPAPPASTFVCLFFSDADALVSSSMASRMRSVVEGEGEGGFPTPERAEEPLARMKREE